MKNSNPDDTKKYASTRLWKKRWYRITSFLAAVVVFCTTYALILPAVTQERAVAQDTGVSVSGITISEIIDGEGPFDTDDEAGNDPSEKNRKVRTFDTVKYTFTVSTDGKTYDNARVKMEFILPLKKNEAEFDVAAMGWMDTTVGYTYNYQEDQTRKINGIDTNCQVLTCYKHLQKTDPGTAVIPGSFTETFTVKVKAMKNKDIIQPTITASLELHLAQVAEKTADAVTVSAAPRYNVKLDGGPSYKDTFDFDSGHENAPNNGKGNVVGRAMKFGVTLQLYNNNNNKGFKGIELPKGSITFDLKLKSKYGSGGENDPDVTKDYTPLLWSCDYNYTSWTNKKNSDERDLTKDFSGSAYEYAPWSSGPDVWYGDDITCFHGGGWSAKQTGDTISVTVFNYEIDVNQMPTKNGDGGSVLYNPANGEGCFSSGEIWIVQPFNKKNSTTNSGYDIQNEKGNGTFYTTVEVQNLKSTSIGGTAFNDTTDTNDAQMKKDDDSTTLTLPLYSEGNVTNRIAYRKDDTSDKGVGVNDPYDGKDFATPGTGLYIYSGIDYTDNGEEKNTLYWANNFTRINADIFEVTGEPKIICKQGDTQVYDTNYKVFYVAEGKGGNWIGGTLDEIEGNFQSNSTGEWLYFYDTLDEIKKSGKVCTGVLYCVKGPLNGDISFSARLPVKVRNGLAPDQIGKAYMTVSTSRVWTKEHYENTSMTLPDINTYSVINNKYGFLAGFPKNCYEAANIRETDSWGWYKKEEYQADGSASRPHNSSWNWFGDTLLVIKFKSQINKTLLQKLPDDTVKDTFNLDANQRYVDFMLQPTIEYDNKQGSNMNDETTLTIVDTLPKGLKYVKDSAYIGGEYRQTSDNGGTQGEVTGEIKIIPSADENATPNTVGDATLFIKEEADGTTTLTWKVKCKIGEPVKPIYYSVEIGDRYNASNDIPVGTTQLPYNVRIYAAGEDLREPTAANGNYVKNSISATRGNAYSFGKYTTNETVEPNGNIDYKIYYDNISTAKTPVKLVDVMPADGVNGSQFSGTYTVESFKFDTTKCDVTKLSVYYTEDKAYQNNDIVDENEINNNWIFADKDYSGAVKAMNGKTPVAFAVLGTLDAEESVNIDLTIKLNCASKPNLTYVDFDSPAASTFYNDNNNNYGAKVVKFDEAHGNSIYFTQMSSNKNETPHSIAVSNFDGTGRFEVKKGKKYTLSYDYRFEKVQDDLQVAAMIATKDKNANSLGRLIESWDQKLGDPFLWSEIKEQWVSTTFSFEARRDGYVFIVPFGWDKESNGQKIWLDNIKIEEIQENKYVNAVISGANSTTQQTTATTPIIRRSIEGLTWIDRNSDGVQNDGSNRYISGVKVSLLKLKVDGNAENEDDYKVCYYADNVTPVTVETGKQVSVISQGAPTNYIPGRYRFMDLPEGTYAVKFEDGTGENTKISPLIASPANRGEDDTLDSDGIAVYKSDRSALEYTLIKGIVMPAAADGYTYESKCNDSGFYERGYELPKSGGKGTDAYTFLGLTIWGFALLAFVYRKARKTFGKSK